MYCQKKLLAGIYSRAALTAASSNWIYCGKMANEVCCAFGGTQIFQNHQDISQLQQKQR